MCPVSRSLDFQMQKRLEEKNEKKEKEAKKDKKKKTLLNPQLSIFHSN